MVCGGVVINLCFFLLFEYMDGIFFSLATQASMANKSAIDWYMVFNMI